MLTLLLKVPIFYVGLISPVALLCSAAAYTNLRSLMAVAARTIFKPSSLIEKENSADQL